MSKLFEPFEAKGLRFKNRIIHEPTTLNMSDPNNYATRRMAAAYGGIANGGIAAVIVGATCVRRDGLINERMLGLFDETYVVDLRDTVMEIKSADCLAGIQLFYGGLIPGQGATVPLDPGRGWIPGTVTWGPSDKYVIGNPKSNVVPTDVYESLVEDYGQAARRAREAGFDFVSFHFNHGSLPYTNLSLLSNQGRRDKYADRFLFCEEILLRTQALCGKDFPIIPRLCCDENLEGGYDIAYFAEHYAPRLHALGIAVLDCTFGSMIRAPSRRKDITSHEFIGPHFHTPQAVNLDNIKTLRKELVEKKIEMPLVGSANLVTPDLLRSMVSEGAADFAGVCRMSMDDPDFPNKILTGREDEIRLPVRTGASLLQGNIFGKGWAGSAQNASFGREDQYRIHATAQPRKVVVIGGGCGGMEYAITAKAIGHHVILFEKSNTLGGAMDWVGNYPHLPNMDLLRGQTNYHRKMMEKLNVEARLGAEATEAMVLAERPDVIVVATGAKAVLPKIEGLEVGRERGYVLTIDEAMAHRSVKPVGKSVIVWGAGEGAELALEFSRQGRNVRLLDSNSVYTPAIYIGARAAGISRFLAERGLTIETGRTLERVEHGKAVFRNPEGTIETVASDSLVVCAGREPLCALAHALNGKGFIVQTIGDARKPRSFANAIHEAAYLVRQI